MPTSLMKIDAGAFQQTGVATVVIPKGVTEIGEDAFKNCTNLTKVSLPTGLQRIGGGAFYGDYKLTSISLPENVVEVGDGAFYDSGLETVVFNTTKISTITANLFGMTAFKSVNIPSGVTKIQAGAFRGNVHLSEVTIPDTVVSIAEYAFADKDGNFDAQAVGKAFDQLNYAQKAPQVLAIYKEAQENGFSQKHADQLAALFPQQKTAQKIKMDAAVLENASDNSNVSGAGYLGLKVLSIIAFAAALLAGAASAAKKQRYEMLNGRDVMAIALPVLVMAGCIAGMKRYEKDSFEQIISNPEKMRKCVIQVHRQAYDKYLKDAEKQLNESNALQVKKALAKSRD